MPRFKLVLAPSKVKPKMTQKEANWQQLKADILRLRYGSEEPTNDAKALFSKTCISRYLKKSDYIIEKALREYFYAPPDTKKYMLTDEQLKYVTDNMNLEDRPTWTLA